MDFQKSYHTLAEPKFPNVYCSAVTLANLVGMLSSSYDCPDLQFIKRNQIQGEVLQCVSLNICLS